MNDKQISAVLTYLVDASKNKQLSWDHDIEGDFRINFPKSSIALCRGKGGVYLSFYNDQGVAILTVGRHNIQDYGLSVSSLDFIFQEAENQVFRHDETFEDILSNLKKPKQ